MPHWEGDELTLPEVSVAGVSGTRRELALTILFHPDPGRIGEYASIPAPGAELELARQQPTFCQPRGAGQTQPLADPYLSRAPIIIRAGRSTVDVSVPVDGSTLLVNGVVVEHEISRPLEELETGIVLALSHRVVLLLHRRDVSIPLSVSCGLVGESDALQQVRHLIGRVAEQAGTVLLLGETGTGKELVASAIHGFSRRAERPMVTVNMAAIPPELAAAELFGVRRGAFTGADHDRLGYFQRADGGTLFLDEIGACGPGVQAQLLRALQQGEIQLPGGDIQEVDVRVLAATDASLEREEGGFSAALRYRLGGFEIQLPPLRERREDLGRLLVHFLPPGLLPGGNASPGQVAAWVMLVQELAAYSWPGNVRELANFCQQIALASSGDPVLRVPASIRSALAADDAGVSTGVMASCRPASEVNDQDIRDAMLAARWEISSAARELRISRQALYKRIAAIPDLRIAADIPGTEVESVYHECKGELVEAALRMQVSQAALRRRWRAMDLAPRSY